VHEPHGGPILLTRKDTLLPVIYLGVAGVIALLFWLAPDRTSHLELREPGMDDRPDPIAAADLAPVVGTLTTGDGTPGTTTGSWPGFRGPNLDGVSPNSGKLANSWPEEGPPRLWSVDLGEGYAGAAIRDGRVYVFDYDQEAGADALRCLSFDDGREIWRFSYPLKVKRNHGMSRTVPAVTDRYVVGLGPKCHVTCLDAKTGEERWMIDLVREYGTTVPQWYAGQCPLILGNLVILAPAGPDVLMLAADLETGEVVWKTPNPSGWKMTHTSIVPVEVAGTNILVNCGSRGVSGVDAATGYLLFETNAWKIGIATVATPVPVGDGRVFFSGGYNAGAVMMKINRTAGGGFEPEVLYRLEHEVFGATQQTPILFKGHLYGIRPDGQLVCLDLSGEIRWASGPKATFGLGPFVVGDDLIYALDDDGHLSLMRATPERFERLAQSRILDGPDAWGPLALAGGRLIARDLRKMVCVEVKAP
jgi:outer membrane protein assembly factor BamB